MTQGRRVCLELFVIFFTSRNVQCCYGFLLLQSYHQLALSPIHVLWCYDTFQSYTLMHFNLLRLHIFFCNGRNINPSVVDKENNLSVMAVK